MPSTFLHKKSAAEVRPFLAPYVRRVADESSEVFIRLSTGIQETGDTHMQELLPFCGGHRGEDVAEYESYSCNNHSRLVKDHSN